MSTPSKEEIRESAERLASHDEACLRIRQLTVELQAKRKLLEETSRAIRRIAEEQLWLEHKWELPPPAPSYYTDPVSDDDDEFQKRLAERMRKWHKIRKWNRHLKRRRKRH